MDSRHVYTDNDRKRAEVWIESLPQVTVAGVRTERFSNEDLARALGFWEEGKRWPSQSKCVKDLRALVEPLGYKFVDDPNEAKGRKGIWVFQHVPLPPHTINPPGRKSRRPTVSEPPQGGEPELAVGSMWKMRSHRYNEMRYKDRTKQPPTVRVLGTILSSRKTPFVEILDLRSDASREKFLCKRSFLHDYEPIASPSAPKQSPKPARLALLEQLFLAHNAGDKVLEEAIRQKLEPL